MDRRRILVGASALSLMAASGCAVSPSANRGAAVPGSFAWFDLVTNDPAEAKPFYSGLFGWGFGPGDTPDYENIISNGKLLGGIASPQAVDTRGTDGSQWVPVLTVDDPVAATRKAKKAGGTVVRAPVQAGDNVYSVVRDNRGAVLVLYSGPDGFPASAAGNVGAWGWADLFTNNLSASRRFYKSVAGFTTVRSGDQEAFVSGGVERGGLVSIRGRSFAPTWLPYVVVEDVSASTQKSLKLGGGPLIVEDDVAILLDPTDAAIGIVSAGALS